MNSSASEAVFEMFHARTDLWDEFFTGTAYEVCDGENEAKTLSVLCVLLQENQMLSSHHIKPGLQSRIQTQLHQKQPMWMDGSTTCTNRFNILNHVDTSAAGLQGGPSRIQSNKRNQTHV